MQLAAPGPTPEPQRWIVNQILVKGKPYFSGTLPDRIITTYSDGSTSTYTVPDNSPTLTFTEVPVPNPTPEPTPEPTPTTTVTEETAQPNYPIALKVPGKEGRVISPYAPNAGEVDVAGYQPGSLLKDPYSGKTFITP
jgi:hypothetical protein